MNKKDEEGSIDTSWSGFKPVSYYLDFQKVMALKLDKIDRDHNDQKLASLTIKEIFDDLDLDGIKGVDVIVRDVEVETRKGKSAFRGDSFANSVLALTLRLISKSAHPFSCQLFWFDSDSCMDDPHETYHFFVVHGDKIIEENWVSASITGLVSTPLFSYITLEEKLGCMSMIGPKRDVAIGIGGFIESRPLVS